MPSVVFLNFYAECRYADYCHSAECHYAECRGADITTFSLNIEKRDT